MGNKLKRNEDSLGQVVKILFEDEWVVVVEKKTGVVVNRAESVADTTLQEWHMDRLIKLGNKWQKTEANSENMELFRNRGGVVHRLDKETSGIMVLAKTPDVLVGLMAQFKNRETYKEYVALIHGRLVPEAGFLSLPLGRTSRDRRKFGVVVGGKMTMTEYRVEEVFEGWNQRYQDGFSLVSLVPKTGRTHQLRVVLKHLGRPIVADEKYLGSKRLKLDKLWCPRLFLHAKKLGFTHPIMNKWVEFECGLEEDLQPIIEKIRRGERE